MARDVVEGLNAAKEDVNEEVKMARGTAQDGVALMHSLAAVALSGTPTSLLCASYPCLPSRHRLPLPYSAQDVLPSASSTPTAAPLGSLKADEMACDIHFGTISSILQV